MNVKEFYNKMNMGKLISFTIGVVCGIYIEQNYRMPRVKQLIQYGIRKINEFEESTRK
jgi:hypothetical protein